MSIVGTKSESKPKRRKDTMSEKRVVRLNEAGLRRLVRGLLREAAGQAVRRIQTTVPIEMHDELEGCLVDAVSSLGDERMLRDMDGWDPDRAGELRASRGVARYGIERGRVYLGVVLTAANEATLDHLQGYVRTCEEEHGDDENTAAMLNRAPDDLLAVAGIGSFAAKPTGKRPA